MRLLRGGDSDEPVQILVLRKGEKIKVTSEAATLRPRHRVPATPAAPPSPPAPPAPRDGTPESL